MASYHNAAYLTMNVDKLIEEIRIRPSLWDHHNKLYNHAEMRHRLWLEIAELVDIPVEDAKKKWKVLKDVFRRELKKVCTGLRKEPGWVYYNSLLFLRHQMSSREPAYNNNNNNNDDDNTKQFDNEEDSEQEITVSPTMFNESFDNEETFFQSEESQALLNVTATYSPNLTEHQSNKLKDTKTDSIVESTNKRSHEELEIDDDLFEIEKASKNQMLNGQSQMQTDDDYNFLLSFLPSMRSMPLKRKMLFRLKMQELLYTIMFQENTEITN